MNAMPFLSMVLCFAMNVPTGLFEIPVTFARRCPIVTVWLTEGGKSTPRTFFLDSGCTQSVLFGDDAGDKLRRFKVSFDSAGRRRDLGLTSFIQKPTSIIAPDLAKVLVDNRVEGLLGVDFFKSHDVLIDYKNHKLFLSPFNTKEEPEPSQPNFKPVEVIEINTGFAVTSVITEKPLKVAILTIDTCSDATSLPVSFAGHDMPTDARSATLLGVTQVHQGWIEPAQVRIVGFTSPFPMDIWYVGEVNPSLSPFDLSSAVLFTLRRSQIWIHQPK